ncbi:putative quinol monooxygenase [Roseateles sp. P5_E1]
MSSLTSTRAAAIAVASTLSMLILSSVANAVESKMPFIRIAELEIDPAQLEAFKAAIAEGVEAAVRTEPKVLALYAVAERDRPNHIRVFEIYADEEAYAQHIQTAHFRKFFESTSPMVVSRRLIDTVPVVLGAKP